MNENKCAICGGNLKHVPAGVSKKTGNPYQAFDVCEKGCRKPSQTDEKFEKLMTALRGIYSVLDDIRKQGIIEEKFIPKDDSSWTNPEEEQ